MSLSPKFRQYLSLLVLLGLLLSGCGESRLPAETAETPAPSRTAAPAPSAAPEATAEPERACLRISELMVKNRAVLRDADGNFSDWIEIENYGETPVELTGFRLTEKEGREGLALFGVLAPGDRRVCWASGKDRPEEGHADFSLSEGERVLLVDPLGRVLSAAPCLSGTADRAVALGEDGEYAETAYPTPGWPNTREGYDGRQETLVAESPLVITEVCVYNPGSDAWRLYSSDWVELKNVSDGDLRLSDFCLSDNAAEPGRFRLPDKTLAPGGFFLVRCDEWDSNALIDPSAGFSLDSGSEQLYLSKTDGTLLDYVSLQGIPYGCSFGRMEGENGWFYFASPSPGGENADGRRRVSEQPVLLAPDGVFEGVESVPVALAAKGEIFYTVGDGAPGTAGERYEAPFSVDKTTVVRAVALEEGALPSRPAVFTYIVNEGHTLPVLSLASDSVQEFNWMYYGGAKGRELPASLSLYAPDGGFSIPCGVRMHGETSLELEKKNMSVRFRPVYGQEKLDFDVYGGGISSFTSLVLRAGQDYFFTGVKNAACQNLCLQAGNRAVTGRSRFCVLYLNGRYWGIYNLMEKTNEQLYADLMGVSRDSVEVIESQATSYQSVYRELFRYCAENDLSVPENYEHVQTLVDIDSVIDWVALEGYAANTDLTYGNVRYVRSTEGDGKWRLMFYDLDAAFWDREKTFVNMLSPAALTSRQVSYCLVRPLLQNPDFRDRMLRRFAELLNGVLSEENVTAEIRRLAAELEPEIGRDYALRGMFKAKWDSDVEALCGYFADGVWNRACVEHICQQLLLTDEERAAYFGE